jgi:hypothetical protein
LTGEESAAIDDGQAVSLLRYKNWANGSKKASIDWQLS